MKIISSFDNTEREFKILRHKYMPYSEKLAKQAWAGIAKKNADKLIVGETQAKVWSELIKYAHGNETCEYNINDSLFIMGMTGSGKTMTMKILSEYLKFDDVYYIKNGVNMTFNYRIISSRELASEYTRYGYDGIAKYMIIGNLCIDDLGSEVLESTHYGTKLNVLTEIIEERYNKGLFTHFTSNLNSDLIREKYNERVYSRIFHKCNMITMNDNDYRLINQVI